MRHLCFRPHPQPLSHSVGEGCSRFWSAEASASASGGSSASALHIPIARPKFTICPPPLGSPRFARGTARGAPTRFPLLAGGTSRRGSSTAVFCELWLGDWYHCSSAGVNESGYSVSHRRSGRAYLRELHYTVVASGVSERARRTLCLLDLQQIGNSLPVCSVHTPRSCCVCR